MSKFKSREEYEKWKAERASNPQSHQDNPPKNKPSLINRIKSAVKKVMASEEQCPACKTSVLKKYYVCPQCNKRLRIFSRPVKVIILFSIVFLLVFLGVASYQYQTKKFKPEEFIDLVKYESNPLFKQYKNGGCVLEQLQAGGWSGATFINLEIDKTSLVGLKFETKSRENPTVYRYSLTFQSRYTIPMKDFLYDFIKSIDPSLDIRAIVQYIDENALKELKWNSHTVSEQFGDYSVRVSNVRYIVTVTLEKTGL